MERINAFPLFVMGATLTAWTQNLNKKPYTYNDLERDGRGVLENIVPWIQSTLISTPLAKDSAVPLVQFIHQKRDEEWLKEHGSEELEDALRQNLISQVFEFANLLRAEFGYFDLYVASQKRDHVMKMLTLTAEEGLDRKIVKRLSDKCISEIREAGRCIAFDLSTASAFHVFRALELVVLMYFPVLHITPPTEKKRSLGTYINLLEGKDVDGKPVEEAPKIDAKIPFMLRHLKDTYRNPIMHPELVLENDEAEDLFPFALAAISTMVRDIMKRKPDPEPESAKQEGQL